MVYTSAPAANSQLIPRARWTSGRGTHSSDAHWFKGPSARFHKGPEVADHADDDVAVADDDVKFEVVSERLVGEVGAAKHSDVLVSCDELGVERGSRLAGDRPTASGPGPESRVLAGAFRMASMRRARRARRAKCRLPPRCFPGSDRCAPPLGRVFKLAHDIGDAEGREVHHQQRTLAVMDHLADHRAGKLDDRVRVRAPGPGAIAPAELREPARRSQGGSSRHLLGP